MYKLDWAFKPTLVLSFNHTSTPIQLSLRD